MDTIKAVQHYITKMVSEVSGMKVLLLDADTTPIISMVFTQSQLLAHEVYLIDRIDKRAREKMKHLKCICFVRPSAEGISAIVDELREPCYGDYYLYFSNILKKSQIERLAEVDEHEVVREIQEYYADYLAVNPDLFSLGLTLPETSIYGESPASWDSQAFLRSIDGLVGLLLSLKKKPLIRYEKNSPMCRRLAQELNYQMTQESGLFDFRKPDTPPILLLLDRRNDPVTPLLNQWTYQGMVHELIGIHNGRVDLSSIPDARKEMREVVLSTEHDHFYKKNMYLNLGDLGVNIKAYVDEYQSKHKSSAHIESISDMKKFVEEYPEFRKLSGNVTKHVTLVGELSRIVERGGLLEVGEIEQSLACVENHAADLKSIQTIIGNGKVSEDNKLRLVLLYALRYEKSPSNQIGVLMDYLRKVGVSDRKISLVDDIIRFCGSEQRQEDLFLNSDVLSKTKAVFKGLKGVENVYTQHTPHLVSTLEALVKGRLKEQTFPFLDMATKDRPQDVIVFFVGGVTYAEAKAIPPFMAANPGVRVIVGGTTIHNSSSFLTEVSDAVNRWNNFGKIASTVAASKGGDSEVRRHSDSGGDRIRSNKVNDF